MMQNDKGLTLIEALAAVVILSVIILSFVNMSGASSLASSKSDKKTVALRLAEHKLNLIRKEINSSGLIPQSGEFDVLSTITDSDGYLTNVYDTIMSSTPSDHPVGLTNKVVLQDIFVMKNDSNLDETRLIFVAVSWET